MVGLIRAEKMVLSGLVFARKIARMISIQNVYCIGFDGSPDDQHGIYTFIYVRNERCHACDGRTDERTESGK